MKVKLVSITQPLIRIKEGDRMLSPEELIVYCARVSNPSNQLNIETAPKLINYCIKHKHWSVFEQVDFTVEVETSRAISAQIIRHKFNVQEFSARYSLSTGYEDIELRYQGATNRQVGDEVVNDPDLDAEIREHLSKSKALYDKLIQANIAKECARMVLPLTTRTTLYLKNNVRGWIHYLEARTSINTQKEHRLIANEVKKIFINNFPNISEALGYLNLNAP